MYTITATATVPWTDTSAEYIVQPEKLLRNKWFFV